MKNCKKRNASFDSRIFYIALVTMLTATALWAKPKNTVEYTPFKSENPNATVFECEYIPDCSRYLLVLFNDFDSPSISYEASEAFKKEAVNFSSITVYGWKKKKGGWEKLGEYDTRKESKVLEYGINMYTHYAVEVEVPENSLTFLAKKSYNDMGLHLHISKDYEKSFYEKRAAKEAMEKEIALKELFNKYKTADAELKKKSKGYEYHGISECYRTYSLLKGKSLTKGHAYVSGLKFSNDFSRAEFYGREWAYSTFIDVYKGSVHVQYADASLREQIVLLRTNYNDEIWYCYTPDSNGDIAILGFAVTKNHRFPYNSSEENLALYAKWLSQGN